MSRILQVALVAVCVVFVAAPARADNVNSPTAPDGKTKAVADGNTVKLVDVASGKEIRAYKGHTDAVSALAFSPDGKRLASGGKDNTINLWDMPTGKLLAKIRTGAAITSLTYSPDAKTLTSREADNSKKVYDAATGKRLE
jgi:WD40 repeat protein